MKKRNWQNTPFIAVMMMLVAVVAVMFFTEPPKAPEPPSAEELAPILGEWVPAWTESVRDQDFSELRFTLQQDLTCTVHRPGYTQATYTYNREKQIVTVSLSDAPEDRLTYTLTEYYGFPALQSGQQYYVRQMEYQALRDVMPPVIVQRSEAELTPILGEWTGLAFDSYQYFVESVVFRKDMTCSLLPKNDLYPDTDYSYNFDPASGVITVYTAAQQSLATKYRLVEIQGFSVLVNQEKTGTINAFSWDKTDANYIRPEYRDTVYALSPNYKLQRHQNTEKILLEGKTAFEEVAPYQYKDELFIAAMFGSADNSFDTYLQVDMVTTESARFKLWDALTNVRLVSTSVNDTWTQEELERQYSIPLSGIMVLSEGHGKEADADQVLKIWTEEFDADAIQEDFWGGGLCYLYRFDRALEIFEEDLAYQSWFVFFEIYGAEGTFYVQLS